MNGALSRWQQFYRDDPKLGSIPASACAREAVRWFAEHGCRLILDLGCGTGRDSCLLAGSGVQVIGVDAARSGLALAQQRAAGSSLAPAWVEADARRLPFAGGCFDGVFCFGLLHEFVGSSAETDVEMIMGEIQRVLRPAGAAVVAAVAGELEQGLPHVRLFSEAMFAAATARLRCVRRQLVDDLGCTGRTDYRVWSGYLIKD